MASTRFQWDSEKAESNYRKHGIRFEDAAQVFRDPLHLSTQDRIEDGELRWQTIGQVHGVVVLLVAHAVRDEENDDGPVETIRIISARRATKAERKRYEDNDPQ